VSKVLLLPYVNEEVLTHRKRKSDDVDGGFPEESYVRTMFLCDLKLANTTLTVLINEFCYGATQDRATPRILGQVFVFGKIVLTSDLHMAG
jgi:hypothetical protein